MINPEDLRRRMTRAQRQGTHGTAAKDIMLLLALIGLCAAGVYWWGVYSTLLPTQPYVAVSFTIILTLAPPVLVSFCIPWSPGGMLLQKINARTWGMMAVVGCAIYLLYYSYQLQWSWWAAQPAVAQSNLVIQQAIVGIIGYVIIPALLWTPVSSEELQEKLKQAQLVKHYELQTAADIAIMQATLLRAQQQATIGFANLTIEQREELAAVMLGLVGGIDRTIQEMAGNLNKASTAVYGVKGAGVFGAPAFTEDLVDLMDYVASSLAGSTMTTAEQRARIPALDVASTIDVTPHVRAASQSAVPREAPTSSRDVESDPRSSGTIPDHEAYVTARHELGTGAWLVRDLATTLSIEESTARKLKAAWQQSGAVVGAGMNGRFRFTEREVK